MVIAVILTLLITFSALFLLKLGYSGFIHSKGDYTIVKVKLLIKNKWKN